MKLLLAATLTVLLTASALAAEPVAPVFNAPFTYVYDNYLSDSDTIMTIEQYTTDTNTLTINRQYGAHEIMLIRGDLNKGYLVVPEFGKDVCISGAAQSYDKTVSFKGMQFIDQVYVRDRLCNHFQFVYGQDRRLGVYIDAKTGMPVKQQPTFQFATMVWDYLNFTTGPIDDDVFAVPDVCKNATHDQELFERMVMDHPAFAPVHGPSVAFEQFKRKHNKQYSSDKEHGERFARFADNYRMIQAHNSQPNKSWKMGVNHLADLHPEEMARMRGRFMPPGITKNDQPYVVPAAHRDLLSANPSQAIPTSLDWRVKGAVGQPRNQGMCGSCWTFGATSAVSGANFLAKGGELTEVSTQNMVDCAWKLGCMGCDGCTARAAYTLIKQQKGVANDVAYPYIGVDGNTCKYESSMNAPNITVSSYQVVPTGDINALYSAIQKGPIAIAIDAMTKGLNFYEEGVYDDVKCLNGMDDLDHEVLLTGYGVENGKAYWLVQNSWGHLFGQDGMIKIAVEGNICGVATDAVLPIA